MKGSRGGKVAGTRLLSQNKWSGVRSISLAYQLNEQVIECCCALSLDVASCNQIPLVATHRELWSSLEPAARKRVALFPFAIVDMKFTDEAWWRLAAGNSERACNHPDSVTSPMPWDWLALETLMFGWQVAREDRIVASMLFAMSLPVADCIATLSMQQVRTIAVTGAKDLRLRWDGHPRLWRELLNASRGRDEADLEEIRLMAKLYFCGELIHTLPASVDPMLLAAGGIEATVAMRH